MPDIAFKNGAGELTGFVEYRGAPVVALFWATWCTVCCDEMPKLDTLQAKLGSTHTYRALVDRSGKPAGCESLLPSSQTAGSKAIPG